MAEFRLLGSVDIRADDGQVVEIGPPQQRLVLAVLVADAGRPVNAETLIDRVWDTAPAGARRTLQVYVTRIRRLLERDPLPVEAAPQLLRRSGGYVLDIDPQWADLHRFGGLIARAREPNCPDRQRAELLRQAMNLWRGEPLTGLTGAWAAQMRTHLRQQHLDTVIAWAGAELRTGNHHGVIGPLSHLLGEHPLAEPLAARLMEALYAAGHIAGALDCYTSARARLADELGVDPGAELQRLHQRILRGEMEPAIRQPASHDAKVIAVPMQLPLAVAGFVGREKVLAHLDGLMAANGRTAPLIVTLSGTAGVGKSTLAVYWAHQMADRFADGLVYVNLRGFDPAGPAMSPGEAMLGFLDALGVLPEHIPASFEAQIGLYRSILAGKQVMVVLDNARDSAQVLPLLPAGPGCLAVVTSRNRLTSLITATGAHPVALDLFSDVEARQLLARRAGVGRVKAEAQAVAQIVDSCARLPLALAMAAAHAATHPGFPLKTLADELCDAHNTLDALTGENSSSDLRAVFSWSYQAISPEAARLFRLLALHPGPDLSLRAAASLAGVAGARVQVTLAELARASLVTEYRPGRYRLHNLLYAYAAELAGVHDPCADRDAALYRVLDHYLHTAHDASRLLNTCEKLIQLAPPQSGVTPERLTEPGPAMAWFTAEYPVLLTVLRHACDIGFADRAFDLATTMWTFLEREGRWHDLIVTERVALEAARQLTDHPRLIVVHRALGRVNAELNRFDDAQTEFSKALGLCQEPDDLARVHRDLAWLSARQGDYQAALNQCRQALDAHRDRSDPGEQAHTLNAIGWYHSQLGNPEQGLAHCEQALALLLRTGDQDGQAATLDSLGYAHHQLGAYSQALDCYEHAIYLRRETHHRYGEADTLVRLGDVHVAAGDPALSRTAWRQALAILEDLGHPDARRIRTKLNRSSE